MTSNTTNRSNEAVGEAFEPADFPYRVLLSAPESRHIPYFALVAEPKLGRVRTTVISSDHVQSRLVGGNLFRSLKARFGDHIYIDVRRRVSERTALYSIWLAFPDADQAQRFVEENPRYGLHGIAAKAAAQGDNLEGQLQNGLSSGRYDLAQNKDAVRYDRAKQFIELTDKLRKSRGALWGVATLRDDLVAYPDGVCVG